LKEPVMGQKNACSFLRVKICEAGGRYFASLTGEQIPVLYRSLLEADGLMTVPEGRETVNAGEEMPVEILD